MPNVTPSQVTVLRSWEEGLRIAKRVMVTLVAQGGKFNRVGADAFGMSFIEESSIAVLQDPPRPMNPTVPDWDGSAVLFLNQTMVMTGNGDFSPGDTNGRYFLTVKGLPKGQ